MTFQRIANSIVTRLILLGVAIVLLGAAVRWVLLTQYLREDLGRIAAAQQESLAGFVANDLDAKLISRKTMLAQLAATLPVDLLVQPDALRSWLAERYQLQPLFDKGLFVTDAFGNPLADYPQRPERVAQKYADRDYVQGALKGELVFGKPTIGRVAKEPIIPLAAPVKDSAGKVRAVLVGITALSAHGFLTLPQTNQLGEGSRFLVASPRDKMFVAASDGALALQPMPPEGVNGLYDKAMAGYRGSGMMANFAGVEEIGGVASVPTTGWFVVSHIPTSQALATVSRAQRYVAANSIVVTLGFLLFATGGMVLIFKPLLWAARHADRMTLGEIPLEPMPVVRNDEVGHLTQAFNRLLAKLQLQQADLERMAHHDPLTGLPNRTLLADRLQQVLSHAQRNGLRVAVLYIDLDGFKPINDTLGHAAGDEALKEVALRLAATVRESDTLARIGGDEFVVVMRDLDADILRAQAAALVVAEKCQHAFDTPLHLVGQALQLGASIGVAVSDGLASANALRRTADGAMYQAKKAGGHRVVLASS